MRVFPFLIGAFVLLYDQLSKFLANHYLIGKTIPIFHNFLGVQFSLDYATNKGAAWGSFAEYSAFLLLLRIVLIAVLFVYYFRLPNKWSLQVPVMLILAGAIGNVIDTFLYGHVVDMLHFVLWGYDYPIFNLADSAIFIGIALYLLTSFKKNDPAFKVQ